MEYQIQNKEKMFVIGVPIITANDGSVQRDAPVLWDRFFREKLVDKIQNRTDNNLLALYTNYEEGLNKPYTYLVGAQVTNFDIIPEGMMGVEILAAPYALFITRGEFPKSLKEAWQKIGEANLDRAFTTDYEVYPPDFNSQGILEVKLYIAIKS